MALPTNKIKKINPDGVTDYEIIPERLQNNGYEAVLPTLTADSTIALTSNLPTKDSDLTTNDRYVRFDTSTQGLNTTQKSNARTNIGAGTSSYSPTYSSMPYGSTTKYILFGSSDSGSTFIGHSGTYIQQDGGSTYLYTNNKQVLTSHQYIKSLNTNNSTEQTVSTSEAINGSGTISLHKISKTGKYSDLIGTPTIPTKVSDLTNDSGFITGITSTDVTTALGYTPYNSSNPNGYTSNAGTVTSITINTSGTGLSGGSSTAITTSGSRTITLKSSANGNASSTDYPVVLRNATGSIQTEKLAISSGTTTKATLQYNTTTESIDFVF